MNDTLNGKIVRNNGQTYRIIAQKLGHNILVDAECVFGPDKGQTINIKKSRTPVAGEIRTALKLNLVS